MKLDSGNIDSLPDNEDSVTIRNKISKKYLESLFPNRVIKDKEVEEVNQVFENEDPETVREFISNVIEYRDLLDSEECKSFQHFFTTIKFIHYMNSGLTTFESYIRSHSYSKVVQLYLKNKDKDLEQNIKTISNLFSKSKLVIKLQQFSDTPFNLLFAGYRYQAIERLRKEMNTASLSKDRIAAADKLLVHLTPQQNANPININLGDNNKINIIDGYLDELKKIASEQLKVINTNNMLEVINVKVENKEETDG